MFDIFNIRKCRAMRDEIESLTVRLSNEHRKYEKAKERLESAEVDIYNLKLERNNLSDENENLRKKLAEEVGKNDEHSRMVNTLNADLEKVQHSLDESIARRDELERAGETLKEKVAFLESKIKRHNGYFEEDRKGQEEKIANLEQTISDLRKQKTEAVFKAYKAKKEKDRQQRTSATYRIDHSEYVFETAKKWIGYCNKKTVFPQQDVFSLLDISATSFKKLFGNIFELMTIDGFENRRGITRSNLLDFISKNEAAIRNFLSNRISKTHVRHVPLKGSEEGAAEE